MPKRNKGFSARPGGGAPSLDDWVQGAAEEEEDTSSEEEAERKEETTRLTVDMPSSMHMALKLHAVKQGVSMTEIVRGLLREELDL